MEQKTKTFKKGEKTIIVACYSCPTCKVFMRSIGSAGCNHDESFTYFYQCRDCKEVYSTNYDISRYGTSEEDFINAGWEEVK